LIYEYTNKNYVWFGDESTLTYTNFGFANDSGTNKAVLMNPIGYWLKDEYYLTSNSRSTEQMQKSKIVCEKPSCK